MNFLIAIFNNQWIEVEYNLKRCDIKIMSNINIISHPINNQVVLFSET